MDKNYTAKLIQIDERKNRRAEKKEITVQKDLQTLISVKRKWKH